MNQSLCCSPCSPYPYKDTRHTEPRANAIVLIRAQAKLNQLPPTQSPYRTQTTHSPERIGPTAGAPGNGDVLSLKDFRFPFISCLHDQKAGKEHQRGIACVGK